MNNLQVFGCITYVNVAKELRSKFESKNMKCYIIGYAVIGYRLSEHENRQVFIGKYVIFLEKEFMDKYKIEYCSDKSIIVTNDEDDEHREDVMR